MRMIKMKTFVKGKDSMTHFMVNLVLISWDNPDVHAIQCILDSSQFQNITTTDFVNFGIWFYDFIFHFKGIGMFREY